MRFKEEKINSIATPKVKRFWKKRNFKIQYQLSAQNVLLPLLQKESRKMKTQRNDYSNKIYRIFTLKI